MTKKELIKKLNELEVSDDADVLVWNSDFELVLFDEVVVNEEGDIELIYS